MTKFLGKSGWYSKIMCTNSLATLALMHVYTLDICLRVPQCCLVNIKMSGYAIELLTYFTEDDRVHISELMFDLFALRKEDMKNSFIEVHDCYIYMLTFTMHHLPGTQRSVTIHQRIPGSI